MPPLLLPLPALPLPLLALPPTSLLVPLGLRVEQRLHSTRFAKFLFAQLGLGQVQSRGTISPFGGNAVPGASSRGW